MGFLLHTLADVPESRLRRSSVDRVLAFLDVLRGKSMTEDDTEKTALFLLFGDQKLTSRETSEAPQWTWL